MRFIQRSMAWNGMGIRCAFIHQIMEIVFLFPLSALAFILSVCVCVCDIESHSPSSPSSPSSSSLFFLYVCTVILLHYSTSTWYRHLCSYFDHVFAIYAKLNSYILYYYNLFVAFVIFLAVNLREIRAYENRLDPIMAIKKAHSNGLKLTSGWNMNCITSPSMAEEVDLGRGASWRWGEVYHNVIDNHRLTWKYDRFVYWTRNFIERKVTILFPLVNHFQCSGVSLFALLCVFLFVSLGRCSTFCLDYYFFFFLLLLFSMCLRW